MKTNQCFEGLLSSYPVGITIKGVLIGLNGNAGVRAMVNQEHLKRMTEFYRGKPIACSLEGWFAYLGELCFRNRVA